MIVGILVIIVIIGLLGGLYGYKVAFYVPARDKGDHPPKLDGPQYAPHKELILSLYQELQAKPCEAITIESADGLCLHGRYYHTADGAPLDICFHGYRSSPFLDFAGGCAMSARMGHNVLLVDQRAHGKSDGHTISFGILERLDVLAWTEYAIDRFGAEAKILLFGVSMGAATVLMAAGLPLPANVKGIIADCPFTRPLDIILDVGQRSTSLPAWLIKPFVCIGAKIFGGFDLQETDAVAAVSQARFPILILHGEADRFVPCTMSEAPVTANPDFVERHTFPDAGHALCYLTDPKRYEAIVQDFIQRSLY